MWTLFSRALSSSLTSWMLLLNHLRMLHLDCSVQFDHWIRMFRYEGLLVLSSRSPELLVRHGSSPLCVKVAFIQVLCDLEALDSLDRARRTDNLDVWMCSMYVLCVLFTRVVYLSATGKWMLEQFVKWQEKSDFAAWNLWPAKAEV